MLNEQVRQKLIAIAGAEGFKDDPQSLVTHSYDGTPMLQSLPDGVIYPADTAQVSAIMKVLSEHRVPLISRGSGTNLCGGTVPVQGGVVMVMHRMNRILEVDLENLTAVVQPGLNTKQFITHVESLGLFYPPDPSSMSISTLGGNIAECSGGLRGLKYGTTKDYVIGLEAVLPSGEIIRTGGKLMKDVAGYDLTKLLVGSEGTLAVITEATLKLIPPPKAKKTMLAMYKDLYGAARTVSKIIENRIIPATLEFLDNPTIRVVDDFAKLGLPLDMEAILLIEQDGDPATVERDIAMIENICRSENADRIAVAADEEEALKLLTARRSAFTALARLRPTTILEDATVPRSKIADMVMEINRIAKKHDVTICTFGHAGDGNLHPTATTDARDPEEVHRVEAAFEEIFEAAIRLGGTITGEHGVGLVKAPFLEWKVGAAGIEVMKGIKQAFDPFNLLNPGKVFAKESRKRVVIDRG
ncbi:FAD-binding oxidoreductase [Paenibacillus chitinolyticus]|uniref:FAD-binding oxidoreductase n=1 Tax=Paenibacillus chitinolyticus TaxID=79263 RepID=A0A410WS61_9BACL|nr:FAD-linked oxidase C-terminal domain-containing protein [Paenibacillus chitinolyticus]MCY9589023.1 FAD-binding protein [Paenibacillus chitinolyticus]MCY9595477.1 FAD-binding protein [Paenibacillus chitinolyticus]QAV17249.1 FAD-binding oxidoreductase [Paenibacillus chitinolyticus]